MFRNHFRNVSGSWLVELPHFLLFLLIQSLEVINSYMYYKSNTHVSVVYVGERGIEGMEEKRK